jgi:hypothetical protein
MPSIPVFAVTVPGTFPTINGVVDNDAGWLNMSSAVLDNPGLGCTALFKIARHSEATNNFVDLGVITDPYSMSDETYLVLGIRSPMAGGGYCSWKMIVQFPVPNTTIGTKLSPSNIWFGRDCPTESDPDGGWNTAGYKYSQPKPHWLWDTKFSHKLNRWQLELKIPTNAGVADDGIYFPPIGTAFRLYVCVISKQTDGTYTPHLPWPPNSSMAGSNPFCGMPYPEDATKGWGNAYYE